ncbi:hypothetical protein [Undibacterium sp. Xuan67W]|uniref:COG4315 family predicted lipoprotein n=1 Tax=Undibacterium sp. Xuan67W TaxID=3413057 RepID=UPI003BF0649E
MKISHLVAALLTSFSLASVALAADVPVKKSGDILVSKAGMTLYTFDKDVTGNGKSVCNDACLTLWPALTAAAGATGSGDYTVITRDDGSKQWAYKGKPLYMFAKDKQEGDRTGDNVKEIWHVIKN